MHLGAPKKVFEKARLLRANATRHETMLWEVLRGLRPKGFHFRRQHPIRFYVVDFYCHSAKLIIEVDGLGHSKTEVKALDQEKEEFFRGNGIKVLRFSNEEVEQFIGAVESEIKGFLDLEE